MATDLTRENSETANSFYSKTLKNADGSRLRARRNGKTKTWKTRPAEFKIPVKRGMYEYGYIDQKFAHFWTID